MLKKLRIPLTVVLILLMMTAVVFAQNGPSVTLTKQFSVDGGVTWLDADSSPGPYVAVGTPLQFLFTVTNTGDALLDSITLTDSFFDLTGATIPASLAPGDDFDYTLSGILATAGQHQNTATVSAAAWVYSPTEYVYSPSEWVYDSDDVYYFGYVPSISTPSITVKKYVSVDGGTTWNDAETAPGPSVEEGTALQFRYVVTNSGNVTLSALTLTDSEFDLSAAVKPDSLIPGASFEYILTGVTAVVGQHENTAFASGLYGQTVYSDSDKAHYWGYTPDNPDISLKKYVSVDDGTTWHDAQTAPGPTAIVGNKVQFKFVAVNTGNVSLTDITLTDSDFDLSSASVPASLTSGSSFEYILTGIDVEEGQHENTATVTGRHGGLIYSDSDKAHYKGEAPDISAPAISVKKYVSVDKGKTWLDAMSITGPSVLVDNEVRFKFVVTNTGNVPLTDITLTDSVYSLSGATIPATLQPGKSFEYILTGIKAKLGQHGNTVTATGKYEQQTVSDTDMAHYLGYIPDDKETPRTGDYLPITGAAGLLLLIGGILSRKKELKQR